MKTIFIKLFNSILLFIIIVGFQACDKDWLKPKPLSVFTPESALLDSRGMLGLLSFCEKTVREEYGEGDVSPMITELLFSEICVQGLTIRTGPAQNLNLSITPTSELNDDKYVRIGWFWTEYYRVIQTCNTVISRIDEAVFKDETERNGVLALAYFHRAFCYYRLTNQFGDIPFIGRAVTEPKLDFYSTKREVILEKIKKDMEYAVEWASDVVDRGRPTKGACAHLLTKINLALGYFEDAISSANEVINGGVYTLMTTPFGSIPSEEGNYLRNLGIVRDDVIARLHWPANKALSANKEVLYLCVSRDDYPSSRTRITRMRQCVPFWSNTGTYALSAPDGKSPSMSDKNNLEFQLLETFGRGTGMARSTWYSQRLIWDDPKDLRHKKYNWMTPEDLVYNAATLKGKSEYYGQPLHFKNENGVVLMVDTIRSWFEWPHYKVYVPDPLNQRKDGGYADNYIFRLAETYLLRAEAYWWKGDLPNAMADINVVRTRAGCDAYTNPGEMDIQTILDERARELYYEEPRKTELTRIAFLFAKTGKSYNGETYSIDDFGVKSFFYDRIMEKNNFYNKGVVNVSSTEYKISPYHVLWPIPQQAISANSKGVINQNYGYDGYANNVPPLTVIDPEDDN